jgi:hypothetical protein
MMPQGGNILEHIKNIIVGLLAIVIVIVISLSIESIPDNIRIIIGSLTIGGVVCWGLGWVIRSVWDDIMEEEKRESRTGGKST